MSLRIIPVIDLMNGVVVRGVAGRRDRYRPIVSRLADSAQPASVTKALIELFRPAEIYLADLDAIEGKEGNRDAWTDLSRLSKSIWIDAGVRTVEQAEELALVEGASIVLGSETTPNPRIVESIVKRLGSERLVFSLDMKAGRLLGDPVAWQTKAVATPLSIVEVVVSFGVARLIVLDLAQVGTNGGNATEELCRKIVSAYPNLEVITGGGIRGVEDLRRLRDCGVRGALTASALHDGGILPGDWPREGFQEG